jgi:hypothetical protein
MGLKQLPLVAVWLARSKLRISVNAEVELGQFDVIQF